MILAAPPAPPDSLATWVGRIVRITQRDAAKPQQTRIVDSEIGVDAITGRATVWYWGRYA